MFFLSALAYMHVGALFPSNKFYCGDAEKYGNITVEVQQCHMYIPSEGKENKFQWCPGKYILVNEIGIDKSKTGVRTTVFET